MNLYLSTNDLVLHAVINGCQITLKFDQKANAEAQKNIGLALSMCFVDRTKEIVDDKQEESAKWNK